MIGQLIRFELPLFINFIISRLISHLELIFLLTSQATQLRENCSCRCLLFFALFPLLRLIKISLEQLFLVLNFESAADSGQILAEAFISAPAHIRRLNRAHILDLDFVNGYLLELLGGARLPIARDPLLLRTARPTHRHTIRPLRHRRVQPAADGVVHVVPWLPGAIGIDLAVKPDLERRAPVLLGGFLEVEVDVLGLLVA